MKTITSKFSSGNPLHVEEMKKRVMLNNIWGKIHLFGNHWHLYRNDSGGAGVVDNNRKVEFLPGRWYLVPPYKKMETWCNQEHPVYQFYIHFTTASFSDGAGFSLVELPEDQELNRTYEKLKNCNISSNIFPLLLLKLTSAACCMLPENSNYEGQFSPKISMLLHHISQHLGDQFGLDEMAELINMSKNTLLRHFKNEIGLSPYQYLSNLRYTEAANLLTQSDLPLEEICEIVGIRDRFHFSRMFKNIYGQSPGFYRRAHKNAVNMRDNTK